MNNVQTLVFLYLNVNVLAWDLETVCCTDRVLPVIQIVLFVIQINFCLLYR